jgi:hypothetical protein
MFWNCVFSFDDWIAGYPTAYITLIASITILNTKINPTTSETALSDCKKFLAIFSPLPFLPF